MGVLEDVDRYSSLDQLRGLYVEYADYEAVGSVARCGLFIQVATGLLAKLPSSANLGTEAFSMSLQSIREELAEAKRWFRAMNRETAGTVLSFNDFDVM